MGELFRIRTFRIVFYADLLQQLSIWIRNMALLFFIIEQTDRNPIAISLLSIAEYAPIFLISFIGGALADRWNPKRTMIAGDLLSAVSVIAIWLLVGTGIWQAVFAATAVSAIVSQFSQPSSSVLFKRHVPDRLVSSAIGLAQGLVSVFLIIGPAVGTLIYEWFGVSVSLLTIACLFVLSAWIQRKLPDSDKPVSQRQPLLRDLKEGLSYVRGSANLVVMLWLFAMLGLGAGIVEPLEVFILVDRLGLEEQSIQWFLALAGIGLLIGGGIAAVWGANWSQRTTAFVALLALAVSMAVKVCSQWVALTVLMEVMVGSILAFMQVALGTLMIRLVDEAFVGRVSGLMAPAVTAGTLLGAALSGFLMEWLGLFAVYGIAASLIVISALISLRLKDLPPSEEAPLSAGASS